MTKISVIIPWRPHPSREFSYQRLIEWYANYFPMIEVISSDSGHKKFNLSASRNLGAKKAIESGCDIIIFNDADTFAKPDQLQHAIAHSEAYCQVAVPYSTYYQHRSVRDSEIFFKKVFMQMSDKRLGYAFSKPSITSSGLPNKMYPCSGIVVVPKDIFNELDGFEESIEGWGPEDVVFHRRYFDLKNTLFTYIDGSVHSTYNDPSWRVRDPKDSSHLAFSRFEDVRK